MPRFSWKSFNNRVVLVLSDRITHEGKVVDNLESCITSWKNYNNSGLLTDWKNVQEQCHTVVTPEPAATVTTFLPQQDPRAEGQRMNTDQGALLPKDFLVPGLYKQENVECVWDAARWGGGYTRRWGSRG